MEKILPKIFIGSSAENLDAAYGIQENLAFDAICSVWSQGIFSLSNCALDNLLKATNSFNYAIFVFNPDDVSKIRGADFRTVRDNVIFEFGLFISKLGKDKVFFLIPHDSEDLLLPTDLIGLEPGKYFPQKEKQQLLASLGPFCNKIRNIISSQPNITVSDVIATTKIPQEDIRSMDAKNDEPEIKEIDYGVSIDKFGNYIITQSPTTFFSYRFAKSFPGVRDLQWFDDPSKALDRLELLLKEPLKYERSLGYGVTTDPIWWFRGNRDLFIDKFQRLGGMRFLMDIYELNIKRIAAFNSGSYWQSFIYVETQADDPTGLYNYSNEEIEERKNKFGYVTEEYGLYENKYITRNCLDDGAAEIDGKIVDTSGAALRARVLTDYNFIITSKYSPMNTREFRNYSDPIYNGLLKGDYNLEELIDYFLQLPRHNKED